MDLTSSLIRRNAPIFIGMLVMFICSMLYCMISANLGHLESAAGVLLFGIRVGNISRYWDPFIMGVFSGIVTYCWGKVPPVRAGFIKSLYRTECIIIGFLIFSILSRLLGKGLTTYIEAYNCSGAFLACVMLIAITPFGMRGAVASTVMCTISVDVVYGSIPAVLLVTLVYLSKWMNWWIFNIIRHGFTGAKSALKSSGDAGAVVQQS